MGTYLSTPVLEKDTESGDALECPISPLAWGVVDMQGWRKTMEDAHVACTDIEIPLHLDAQETKHEGKIFGVFDGHGGAEVARFCQLYLVDVIKSMTPWKEASPAENYAVGRSLVSAFHAIDLMVDDPARREELIRLQHEKPQHGERRSVVLDLPEGFYEAPMPRLHNVNDEIKSNTEGAQGASQPAEPQEAEVKKEEAHGDNPGEKLSGKEETAKDDDSVEAVGRDKEEHHEFPMEDDIDKKKQQIEPGILERLLDIGGGDQLSISRNEAGQVEMQVTDEDDLDGSNVVVVKSPEAPKHYGPSTSVPTVVHNGRQMCNLPDHPIHAGCTAVVAVLIGRTLTIANAGDSRAVLCRGGGRAEALSFDHKPSQEREKNRITKAGGFVNQFGRVNGNLNLSRSIGDLKYKQVPGLSPAEQMITAQPDIVQVTLQPEDEFFILGCDGIWDCLTNEEAVQYVRERIDSKTPIEIGSEMLDDIISDDPRATQGIGGDNMTIMVVDLQPGTRAYR